MEPTAPLTRKRRKRAHSTKCTCCCEDRGKPEKEPRRRRREDSDSKLAGEGLWQSESLPSVRVVQTSKTTPPNASEDEKAICEFDNISDRKTVNEGRILRSGRNTPVSVEVEKDKGKTISPLKKPSKIVKKPRCCSQKGKKPTKPTSKHEKRVGDRNFMPSLTSFKPVSENSFDNHAKDSTTTSSGKAKTNKKKSKVESTKFISAQLQENHIFSHQMGQTSDHEAKVEKIKRKIPGQPNKKQVKRKNDNLALLRKQPAIKKKSLTVDRLKVKAFDQLKEKLEVAFDQNSLTVPQCVEFIQKITLPNLKNMFDDATSDTRKTACEEVNIEEDISSEMTESGSETRLMEKELAENMNESEAAKTLVSFKVQTTAVVSSSSPSYTQTSSTVHELSTPQERTASVSTQKSEVSSPGSCYNMNILTTSSSFGSSRLPAPSHPSKRPEFQATVSSSVVIPPVVSSAAACPTPLTFQLLQVPTHGNSPSRPPDIASAHIQQAPGFLCQNPTSINKLAPTQVISQQPGTIFPQTLNQLLYFSKLTQQQDQKAILNLNQASFLPGLQAQDQTIGKSGFVPASHTTASTSVANISVSAPASTSTTEVIFSSKLRPILPREPLVASNFVFNQSLQQNLGSTGKIVDTPTNVKQAVKRLVNERSRSTDPSTPAEVATSLPDIASTFRKNSFPQTSISEFHGKKESSSVKEEQQDCTEMANKEQAIKALLSIGGNESLSQSTSGNLDLSNRAYDTKDANELKVVFDTDKGIFKVDDVTIDPQVNSIGKESYTCNKCGKIFTSLSYLARHIKRVCPDMSHRKWKCTHCDKAFRHPFGLQQHVYTHTGERPHKCPQCPKAFYSSNDLRRHSRIHSGERPYKCKHCGKSFATTISLKTHTFIHTGEKPHRCPHCPKTFATSSKLGRHIVTHSEQRPFSCMQCPKTFNRSGDLRRHSLHVHNGKLTENVADGGQFKEKTYRCTECSDSFASCKELELHINEHTTKWIGK